MIDFLKKSSKDPGSSTINIFVQSNQPEGYNGIWIKSDTFSYEVIVETANKNSLTPSAINIVKGTKLETILSSKLADLYYTFDAIYLTDSSNNVLYDEKIYYGNGNRWIDISLRTKLEYIESSGTQYIDTGLIMSTNMRIEMQYKLLAITVAQCIIGESVAGWNYYAAGLSGIADRYGIDYGSTAIIRRNAATSDRVDTVVTNTSLQNGAYTDTSTNVLRNNGGTLCLLHNGSYPNDRASARIYYCKIYNNSTLVRDFIPVKDSDGIVCLFDKVSKQFFYNAGTGNFTAGKEIFDNPATELEYIESSGTQYIDTEIACSNNIKTEIRLTPINSNNETSIMGARNNYQSNAMDLTLYCGGWYVYGNNAESELDVDLQVNTTYDVVVDNNIVRCKLATEEEYSTVKTFTAQTFSGLNLFIFGECFNNSASYLSKIRIHGLKMYKNGTLVRDFVPAKDNNNVVCLFDRVSKTYFYNSGTGNFIPGGVKI